MRWFIIYMFCLVVTIALILGDFGEWRQKVSGMKQIDSTAIYRQEVADLDAELTKALALQQCYHEELVRLVLEFYPDTVYMRYKVGIMDTVNGWCVDAGRTINVVDTIITFDYTIPCNGRKVVTR